MTLGRRRALKARAGEHLRRDGDPAPGCTTRTPREPTLTSACVPPAAAVRQTCEFTTHVRDLPAPVTPVVQQENCSPNDKRQSLPIKEWPPIIQLSELEENDLSPPVNSVAYTVQSPDSSSAEKNPPMTDSEEGQEKVNANFRTYSRNQKQKMVNVMEQAANISKKTNLEGLYKEEDKKAICLGADQMMAMAKELPMSVDGAATSSEPKMSERRMITWK